MAFDKSGRPIRGTDGTVSLTGVFSVLLLAALVLANCATAPQVIRGSSNYLEKGMTSPMVKGGEFYMATGQVDLYKYDLWGTLKPSGKTVDIAVVIQADAGTGQVLRIATLQPRDPDLPANSSGYENGAVVLGNSPYLIGDLRGGISITDIQPYPRWLDAIDAMRKAIADLGTYTNFASVSGQYVSAVSEPPVFIWWDWRWGRPYYRHWRH
jgi:hypothetical protein